MDIPFAERPRERCLEMGARCLSLRECLALILGSGPPGVGCLGLASRILERPGVGMGNAHEERAFFTAMEVSGEAHLKELLGLGPAGQAKILAAFEMGRRYALFRQGPSRSHPVRSSLPDFTRLALSRVSQKMRNEPQEWLGFVPIHRTGDTGELCIVERGARTHVNIDPGELFARLLALRPRGFFLIHNHPSGVLEPSPQDFDLTERVKELSAQLGIQLIGHWIVGPSGEYWLACP